MLPHDELLFLRDEIEVQDHRSPKETWKVLIVDDDQEIHTVTKLVLSDFTFEHKELLFFSAYNGPEAIDILNAHPDIALVFLDVVMETEDSGLKTCQIIREELKNAFVRIILRTGQPGQAPERYVIDHYDINDYREKTELTSSKLYTTTMAALRSYRDLMKIDHNKKGLEKIIESSNAIGQQKSLLDFIQGVLMQLTSILAFSQNAFYSQLPCFAASNDNGEGFKVMSAVGKYTPYVQKNLFSIDNPDVCNLIREAIQKKESIFLENSIVLFMVTRTGSEHILFMEGNQPLDIFDIELIELFITNVAVAYDNIYLKHENEETQREIIFGLGELTEARSQEVGKHVKRMAEYCLLLAQLVGLDEKTCDEIYIASTMHDVGKLAIPDALLNKPGKLTPVEFELIKTHTTSGYEMLRRSTRPVMQMAAVMALEHHERYDGTGYPKGLKGKDIHIAGRIAAIADVFDALGTDRVYKDAWPLDQILSYMQSERGKHFDPVLIDLFFEHLDAVLAISTQFKDD